MDWEQLSRCRLVVNSQSGWGVGWCVVEQAEEMSEDAVGGPESLVLLSFHVCLFLPKIWPSARETDALPVLSLADIPCSSACACAPAVAIGRHGGWIPGSQSMESQGTTTSKRIAWYKKSKACAQRCGPCHRVIL